ncbi:hypothetical protein AB6A40_007440 [Gnathostoma spinigerum]|uniref:Uncharacterized protein n=1 Tax=Gnathostoma spinigerum TaxID=75299 RepID=A0ABD6EN77_9BILA
MRFTAFNTTLTAFILINSVIVALLYKYTTHPSPLILICQFMLPLIIWQVLLLAACFPNVLVQEFVDFDEQTVPPEVGAGDRRFRNAQPIEPLNSHGDTPRSIAAEAVEDFRSPFFNLMSD